MSRRIGFALSASLLFPALAAGQVPIGAEFRVNTYTTSNQDRPRVAGDGNGNFVVVWTSDHDGSDPFAQRYDSTGVPLGGEFRINTYTTGYQSFPSVAADSAGNFVVAWASQGEDGDSWGVFARRYTSAGSPAGLPFRVNTFVTGAQSRPAVGMNTDGRFVVTWQSYGQDGSFSGVFGQRYDAAGAPQGGEFQVNTYITSAQAYPATAMDPDGNFVVAWISDGQDGHQFGIFAQRFSSSGAAMGPEFRVNTYTTYSQGSPVVGSDAAGNFLVAWNGIGLGDANLGVFARRYDAAGVPLNAEFVVNATTTELQFEPSVAVQPNGTFTVAWRSGYSYASELFARRFDALGVPEGNEFALNAYTTSRQQRPSVAAANDGTVLATWESLGQDGSFTGVFGRRFRPDLIFRDDFETGALGAWSASSTDGGDLAVSVDGALGGSTAGLRGVVDDTAGLYVQDDRPDGEGRYRARFYFDPNGFDPGEALNHRRVRLLLAFSEPNRRVAAVVLRRLSGTYSVMARARLDDNSQADTGFQAISDGPHVFEIDLVRASGPDANDGSIALFVDGLFSGVVFGLDNSLSDVDFARLGALSVKAGAGGTMYWDQFVSRRLTYTGP